MFIFWYLCKTCPPIGVQYGAYQKEIKIESWQVKWTSCNEHYVSQIGIKKKSLEGTWNITYNGLYAQRQN